MAQTTREEPLKGSESKIPKGKLCGLDYEAFYKRVQYVFSTVNSNEFKAATTILKAPDIENGKDALTCIAEGVYIGMIDNHPVGLIQHGPGRECADMLQEGVGNFPNAEYLVAVGVCYGFSREKTKFADVLISNKIIDLGPCKMNEADIELRGGEANMKKDIKGIFCFYPDQVRGLEVARDRFAKHFVGEIASFPIQIDNAELKEKIWRQCPKAYGGEMEGGELSRLQNDGIKMPDGSEKKIQVIVIKAVTDYADGTKNKEWQFIGAQAAFHYVKYKMTIQSVKHPKPAVTGRNTDGVPESGIEPDGGSEYNGGASEVCLQTGTEKRERKDSSVIKLKDLVNDLRDIAARWHQLGIHLHFRNARLKRIKADVDGEESRTQYCFEEVIYKWLDGEYCTVEVLASAVEHCEHRNLAQDIRQRAKEIKLNETEVIKLLGGMKDKYSCLALHLKVPHGEVKAWEKNAGDCAQCLHSMLDLYLREKSPDVDALCQALKDIDMPKLSEELRKKYKGERMRGGTGRHTCFLIEGPLGHSTECV